MRIFVIRQENLFEIPSVVAYNVVEETRRHYHALQGDIEIKIPKSSRAVYADPARVISEYDHQLSNCIKRLENQIAEIVKIKRSKGVDVWSYNKDGSRSHSLITKEGRWVSQDAKSE